VILFSGCNRYRLLVWEWICFRYLFQDTSSGDLYSLLVCFMYLFQDTSSGDLYALLVYFMFCFRI